MAREVVALGIQRAVATLRAGLFGSDGPETSYLGHNTVDMPLWVRRRAQRMPASPACHCPTDCMVICTQLLREKEPSEAQQWSWASKDVDSCEEESVQEGQKLHLVLQKSSGM